MIEGNSTDLHAIEDCITGADPTMMCVGSNESKPDLSLMYDSGAASIDALKLLHKVHRDTYPTPTILMVRAALVNPSLDNRTPMPVRYFLDFCLYCLYLDLKYASDLYRSAADEPPNSVQVVFVDPGALHDADGMERTGYELVVDDKLRSVLSYPDLGAAFCELAMRREEFVGKGVGVNSTGKVKMAWGANRHNILVGAINRILHFFGLA